MRLNEKLNKWALILLAPALVAWFLMWFYVMTFLASVYCPLERIC